MKRLLLALSAAYIALLLANIKLAGRLDSDSSENQEHPSLFEIRNPHGRASTHLNASNNAVEHIIGAGRDDTRIGRLRSGKTLVQGSSSRPGSQQSTLQSASSQRTTTTNANNHYKIAGLDCAAYGGPADASDLIYWHDIPQDDNYSSPFFQTGDGNEKYITFEPDEGGFNNVRMALETVIAMAVAMGRTLVLPPSQEIYLLGVDNSTTQQKYFSFTDFYPLEAIAREHSGLKLITMEEFLHKQSLLVNRTSGERMVPSRTNWNGSSKARIWELHQWLRWIGLTPTWTKCVVGFAPTHGHEMRLMQKLRRLQRRKARDVVHLPSNTSHRLSKVLAHRKNVCLYDAEWQSTKVIHFTGDIASGTRLLIHFYAYLFFVDPPTELFIKRFVRDHLRYVDKIQCAAARIIEAMKEKARQHSDNKQDAFDTFHVRRGDFKVNKTLLGADEIYTNIEDIMTPQSTLYIATDEVNRSFFEPFFQRHHVYFLNDFDHLLMGLNTNYYGLVEQLVVSRGRIFVGCMFSTFSGFVTRLRGYHSTYDKLPGYQNGTLPTTYFYAPLRRKEIMHTYQQLSKPIHSREFPMGWTGIDLEDRVAIDDEDE